MSVINRPIQFFVRNFYVRNLKKLFIFFLEEKKEVTVIKIADKLQEIGVKILS